MIPLDTSSDLSPGMFMKEAARRLGGLKFVGTDLDTFRGGKIFVLAFGKESGKHPDVGVGIVDGEVDFGTELKDEATYKGIMESLVGLAVVAVEPSKLLDSRKRELPAVAIVLTGGKAVKFSGRAVLLIGMM